MASIEHEFLLGSERQTMNTLGSAVQIESTTVDESPRFVPFDYVECNVPGVGVDPDEFDLRLRGCDCDCDCDLSGVVDCCNDRSSCSCVKFGASYAKDGSLLESNDEVDGRCHPIVECGDSCSCSKSRCINRRVTRFPLCVFLTSRKGWGLKTLTFVPERRFVCEYAGEIVGREEAKKRSERSRVIGDNYLLAVREHVAGGTKILTTFVDPRHKGNEGRFINHSCEPNLMSRVVRASSPVIKLCFFARRNIFPDEELTFDYSEGTSNDYDTEASNRKPCFCASKRCRGFLPFHPSSFD